MKIVKFFPSALIQWPDSGRYPWFELPINPGAVMHKKPDDMPLPDTVTTDDLRASIDAYSCEQDRPIPDPAARQNAAAQGMIDSIRVFGQDLGAINPALGDLASELLQAIRDIGPV